MRVLMCFPACTDGGLCSHPVPVGVGSEVNRIWTILGKERKGGGRWLFKSAFNSLPANYSRYVKLNATVKHGMH